MGRAIFTILGFVFLIIAIVSLIAVPFSIYSYGWLAGIFFLLLAWFCAWCFVKLFFG
jgi:hypothetical protein